METKEEVIYVSKSKILSKRSKKRKSRCCYFGVKTYCLCLHNILFTSKFSVVTIKYHNGNNEQVRQILFNFIHQTNVTATEYG